MEFIPSPNFTLPSGAVAGWGVKRSFQAILIHWWDAPAKRPSIEGVIATFKNSKSGVSAHYVVSDTRTVQMVLEDNIAWHAKQANPISIGIECDPNGGEAMYRRLGELVRSIRSRKGNLPLKRHSEYVQTSCPGSINLAKIDQYAKTNSGDDVFTNPANGDTRDAKGWYDAYVSRTADTKKVETYALKLEGENKQLKDANVKLTQRVTDLEFVRDDFAKQLGDARKETLAQQAAIDELNKKLAEAAQAPPPTLEDYTISQLLGAAIKKLGGK
jgi:hypothetical protein